MTGEMVKLQKRQSRRNFRRLAAHALDHPKDKNEGRKLPRAVALGKTELRHREAAKGEFRRCGS